MPTIHERVRTSHRDDYYLEILSTSDNGNWVLSLPSSLRAHQSELEQLLGKVFSGTTSLENLALAQQMSLNWCASKCRQSGMSLDDCLADG
ncbi:MAG TPA: hypothetical protein V6C81_03505 [Planktothrix sp.]|jgi:hypothetical protein